MRENFHLHKETGPPGSTELHGTPLGPAMPQDMDQWIVWKKVHLGSAKSGLDRGVRFRVKLLCIHPGRVGSPLRMETSDR